MIEQFVDKGLSLQRPEGAGVMAEERRVSVLSTSAIASGKEGGWFSAETNGFVRVKAHGRLHPLGVLRLDEYMNVALAPKSPNPVAIEGLPSGAVAVSFVPTSRIRQDAEEVLDNEGGYDLAVIDANHFPVRQEDVRLAQEFMKRRLGLLEEHDIDFTQVTGVEITVGVI